MIVLSLDYLLLGIDSDGLNRQIRTYKDAANNILELYNSELFDISGRYNNNGTYLTCLVSDDETISEFKKEFDNLQTAAKTLRPELLEQAIIDLLDKYDIPIKGKQKRI